MDSWTGEDKVFHMTGSFMAVTVLAWAIRHALYNITHEAIVLGEWWAWATDHINVIAALLVFVAGIALEAYQVHTGADIFSLKDITANCVGIALAIIVRR